MAVPSDGSYGIPEGLVFSFPVTIDPSNKQWKIVQGLELDDFAKQKIDVTTKVKKSKLEYFDNINKKFMCFSMILCIC
jgi:malate/lactate dehydrogenase